MNNKESFSLRRVFLRLLRIHLFIPLAIFCLLILGGIAYFGEQNLKSQQHQIVESIAKSVNDHLDYGGRILEAIAKAAEVSKDELLIYMKSTWEAYVYFDTLYYLDENNIIKISYPFDMRYLGLDMSNIPDFKNVDGENNIIISKPFISLRTGKPTVYLVRPLKNGGCVVGELSLALFQKDITNIEKGTYSNTVFIMDETGTLLAHPSLDMVKQQVNMSNLDIFKLNILNVNSIVYTYYEKYVIGTVLKIEKTGWIIVVQTGLYEFWSRYATILLLIYIGGTFSIFLLLGNLKKQLHNNVAAPFEELGKIVNELADGNYGKINYLSTINASFSELNKFAQDFQVMSINLQKREAALKESEDRYRGLFNRVPIGLFRASLEGDLLEVNPAVVNIFGYPDKKKLFKNKISDIMLAPFDPEKLRKSEKRRQKTLRDFESQMYRYDGSVIWVRVIVYIVKDEYDNKFYYEGSLENITKRKNAEEAIKKAKQELELQVKQRTNQLLELNKELEQLSSLDGLTGINNRRYFDKFLENEWQRCIRQGTTVSLILLDIDFFKRYNDYYGHQAGDDCLKQVAAALKSVLKRSNDFAARYGGEEFVVVLPDTNAEGALILAEEICKIIKNLKISHEKSPISKYVTVSIGVAAVFPSKDSLSSEIILIADHALYKAKSEGRNRVCFGKNIEYT